LNKMPSERDGVRIVRKTGNVLVSLKGNSMEAFNDVAESAAPRSCLSGQFQNVKGIACNNQTSTRKYDVSQDFNLTNCGIAVRPTKRIFDAKLAVSPNHYPGTR